MSARVFESIVALSVVAFLAITSGAATSTSSSSQCDTDNLQCCTQMVTPGNLQENGLEGLLGLVEGNVGLYCVPIDVGGIGNGADCQQQALCCNDVTQNGLINFGCSPINANP